MLRQRVRTRTSRSTVVGRVLVGLLGIALVWYGLMLLLLALKFDAGFVSSISGYRSAYDYLAALTPSDIDSTTRAITAISGIAAFLIFGFLALRALPRPYLARHDRLICESDRGDLEVKARAVERVAEIAACQLGVVSSARARAGETRIAIDVGLTSARQPAADLAEVRTHAHAALDAHGLTAEPVDVTLVRFDRKQRRELE